MYSNSVKPLKSSKEEASNDKLQMNMTQPLEEDKSINDKIKVAIRIRPLLK